MNDRPPADDPAQPPAVRAAMAATLRRQVAADPDLAAADPPAIGRAIDEVIDRLWSASRVKAFVPVLALRDVRALLADAATPDDAPGNPGKRPSPHPEPGSAPS